MHSKITKRDHYKYYFTQEESKVRQAMCGWEYEFSRVFKPLRTKQGTMKQVAAKFQGFFAGWPEQTWQGTPREEKDKFTIYCFPPPAGLHADEKQTSENPKMPKRQVRQTIWIDLSYSDSEICEGVGRLIELIRADKNSLPPQPSRWGGRSALSKIKLRFDVTSLIQAM